MHLDAYGKNQKVYDAFSNEWDFCYKFGQLSQDDLDDDNNNDDFSMMPADQPLGPGTLVADPLVPTASQPTPAVDRSFSVFRPAEIPLDWHDFKTSQLLYEFYGFVTPLPLSTKSSSISSSDVNLLSMIVGLTRNDSKFFGSPVASFAIEFLRFLNTSKTLKNTSWDIASGN